MWKSAGNGPSLRVLPWHLPNNLGKHENPCHGKKSLSQVKKNPSQNTYYLNIHTLQKHKHTLQNNIKPPQYKLKQIQCKIWKIDIGWLSGKQEVCISKPSK
jgi:hypothetical protein